MNPRRIPLKFRAFLVLFPALLLAACAWWAKPSGPIPTALVPAPHPVDGRPLVVVLPGVGDDLEDLEHTGIAAAIQGAWPEADVLLTGATLPYYTEGRPARHIEEEVIAPARKAGYRRIWLAGASMGGMGTLLYEHDHPDELAGLVLMAPYMGDTDLVKQVAAAGGPAAWDPGPPPPAVTQDNYQRELWRVVKRWSGDTGRDTQVWLIVGDDDKLLAPARLIAAQLPPDHFIELPGKHEWKVWNAGAARAFARIAAAERAAAR